VSGQSPIGPLKPAASVVSGPQARRLVHSDPLNEPDHVIDVRKPAGKVGLSEPPTSDGQSSAPASLVDVAPKRSTAAIVPPASARNRCPSTSPSDLTQKDRHSFTTGPNSLQGPLGREEGVERLSTGTSPRWGPVQGTRDKRGPRVQAGGGGFCLHLRWQRNPTTKAK
jgi:hypothetical protein